MKTVGLEPTTVAEAGGIMAANLGLEWPRDRAEVLGYINDFRDILYNLYSEMRLFDNVFHCIQISSFPNDCRHPCVGRPCHQGFVLPADVVSVTAAFDYGRPMILRSRWREAHVGLDTTTWPRTELVETAEQVCTERALERACFLKMYSEAPEDEGKQVFVEAVLDDTGETRKLRFTLANDGWVVVDRPVREILSVALPSGCKGNIVLAQEDGRVLSVYGPHEVVPVYRKFRIASGCSSGTILVQGVKKFIPVAFDHDIVEVGSRTVLKAAASFLKFRSGTTDTKDINRAEYDRSEMARALRGLQERHRGRSIHDGPFASGPINTLPLLPGYCK